MQVGDIILIDEKNFKIIEKTDQFSLYENDKSSVIYVQIETKNHTQYILARIAKIDYVMDSPTYSIVSQEYTSSAGLFSDNIVVDDGLTVDICVRISNIIDHLQKQLNDIDKSILTAFKYSHSLHIPVSQTNTKSLLSYNPGYNKWTILTEEQQITTNPDEFINLFVYAVGWHILLFEHIETIKKNDIQYYNFLVN